MYVIFFHVLLQSKYVQSNGSPQINVTQSIKVEVLNVKPFIKGNVEKSGIENKLLNIIDEFNEIRIIH